MPTQELCGGRRGAHVMMAILAHGLQSSLLQLLMIISRSEVRNQEQSCKRCCSSCRTLDEGLELLRKRAVKNLVQFMMPSSRLKLWFGTSM